ncbi:hypothetical protein ABFS82_06G138800 [Erythranthe guttata]|uniref:dual specificity tyrosine-phosphorylation-regulated kinase 2-like n=1 Tax=Erythranthe guttata TaxID=4155 RepID=UPI00064D9E6C|nr:PREDICTED: dual specificity tyrosine-phosphorylation-regulated kinase 2-like [Erythranthe guttata]|eukprot:XP_012855498.1 PREDICTED: dual specificity tyrosine-phosphorylation-regulated kinase 2-like [Erythranthe guttata]
MAEVEFESVLEFLRKNGLPECESALMEDVRDISQLGSSELEKFLFPMVPPPPLLRIPSTRRLPLPPDLSDDEFVSLGSSTTELCSSEFINPYGVRTTRPTSEASSERLSQFGTARDYPDFDMQNDLFWYKEKDEDYPMPPLFLGRDFYGEESDDKYVLMADRTGERLDDQLPLSFISDDKSIERVHTQTQCKREDSIDNENDKYDFNVYNEAIAAETHVANDEAGDDLVIHDAKEDDCETFNLRIIHRKNRTGFEENKEFPIVINGIIAGRYYVTEFLGSAAFSKVVQAHDLYSGIDVCLKIIKNDKDFFDQSLDEIKLLKFVNKNDPADEHHILRLYDYFYYQEHLFIVTELLRANLYEFQKFNRESGGEPYFTLHKLQVITRQCLEALSYLHDLGIIHCDLKPENILIKSYKRCKIKIIDLGSSCFQTDHLSLYVQSRSYRAPEVMLGLPYGQKIDLWSLGCILAELCSGEVLFPNEGVVMLLARMIGTIGPIDMEMLHKGEEVHKYFTKEYDLYYLNEDTKQVEYIVPEESSLENHLQICDYGFVEFLKFLLEINPKRRPTAREALEHPWLSHSYI